MNLYWPPEAFNGRNGFMRGWSFITLVALLLVGLAYQRYSSGQAVAQELDIERIQSATVFIMQARTTGEELFVTCISSGTIVSRSGLVLTNAHSTVPSESCPGDVLIVALTIRPDEPPVLKYRAEVAQSNVGLDLALLRITRQLNGRLIEAGTLALPFVELADSDTTLLDDTLVVVGYPDFGNAPVAVVRGTISGFTAEPSGGDKSWIKTSASIPGTMSGGGAYNRAGQLVGIPTMAPIRRQAGEGNCLPIQDTNADGLVNNRDVCIPVGGFINALRPSNFARPLFRAASLGLTVEKLSQARVVSGSGADAAFSRLLFSPSVTSGMPTTVVGSMPTGSTSLYLFFDYVNMTSETVYEVRVTIDGIPDPTFSLAPVRWSGGERGLWYIGSSGQVWPNGTYEFTLFIDGVVAGSSQITIGANVGVVPTFSNLAFGLQSIDGQIIGNGFVLPTGNIAAATFIYQNMSDGLAWTPIWYYQGVEVFRPPETPVWTDGASGAKTISIEVPAGLQPGIYRLELYIEQRLATTADFTIAGAQIGAQPQVFSNQHFTTAESPQAALTTPEISSFANSVEALYTLFNWSQITRGTLWTIRWRVDGSVFYEQTLPWANAESGSDFLTRLTGENGIPDGTYRMELLIGSVLLVSAEAQVGIGQLPIDRFATASGIQLRGQIIDAETLRGVPGVSFIVISEDFSIADFTWDQSQIYALTVTDRNGRFQIDRPLQLGVPYSVLVVADGYLPISADGVELDAETPNPLEMTIYLTRD
ncbi:MAG: trypsin-like peptidase domain-containing protein [Chloroflexi bacterium]|nr:trypsin-like peptidase domain-containing protein [Chloroflexota bacterium]